MRPFGIVVYPQRGQMFNAPTYAGLEHGEYFPQMEKDRVDTGGYANAMFYTHREVRDREMDALAKRYPNVMFCPVEVTTGVMTQPNPKPSKFSISTKGVLPE